MYRSLFEFIKVIVPWVIFALFDVLGQNFNVPFLRDLTNQELAYLVFFTILVGSFAAFHKLLSKLDECEDKLDQRGEINATLSELSNLRAIGVAHRHAGGKLTTQAEIDKWTDEITAWRQDVINQLKELSLAEVGLFDTLDSFQVLQLEHIQDPVVRHEMQMLYAETHRIETSMLRWMGYGA